MDDCHLLHMAINMNISLRTCEQLRIGSLLKLTEHYDFYRHYEIRGLLEASAMLLCVERRSNLEYSLKLIPSGEFDEFIAIYQQIADLNGLNRIVRLVQEDRMVFVLFESAYDDCHSYLKERAGLAGEEVCRLFRQIVEIVHGLHQRGIALNDLKLAKFLFADSSREHLKLENLDGASSGKTSRNFGCVLYQAPERLIDDGDGSDGDDGRRADCWSLGVILYTLAFARYPFHHSNLEMLKSQIRNVDFRMPQGELSSQVQPLVSRLLCWRPEDRLSTGEILEWLPDFGRRAGKTDATRPNESKPHPTAHLSTSKAKSNSSSKEYVSKLNKLIKLTREKIERSPVAELDLKLASSSSLPTVYYCLSSNANKAELEK